ncbi:uncharacterized protein HD556DRAFT_1440764 [Suillus plorans]|uniref:Uncharacterized protein n=1 Tax=Suillus plorans TaxID=116603 RepID=A0A9P7IZ55_9AGAM|nr:uncharacterized protein HD556DRAFT_1440764 [Suillus plorans]KAG1797803.1 hypothetical protein HD556DRAFT_1440764 [Suillus plorans]
MSAQSQELLKAAWAQATAEKKEEKLKEYGLRDVRRNLKHLTEVMNITFADGSVYKDISKMVIYAAHTILTEDNCPLGYLLLHCIRLFLKVDTYAAPEVHTTETISAGFLDLSTGMP